MRPASRDEFVFEGGSIVKVKGLLIKLRLPHPAACRACRYKRVAVNKSTTLPGVNSNGVQRIVMYLQSFAMDCIMLFRHVDRVCALRPVF